MASKFKTRHGIDYWPADMTDLNIDILYAKKWRQLKERHGSLDRDPGDVYVSALSELYGDAYKISSWAEAHVHHWVKHDKPIYWGAGGCGKSCSVAACLIPYWFVEPYTTVALVGSTTVPMLRMRVWNFIEQYFAVAKKYAEDHGFTIPGKMMKTGFAILNDSDADDNPMAQGDKAGIHGVAINEGGKLQGAHMPNVYVIIDELATINNHQDILTALANLSVAEDFKFVAMANPEPWSNPSSEIYCTPVNGISSVTVDTREWDSTFGAHILHDDGLKSPCVLDPGLAKEFPYSRASTTSTSSLRSAAVTGTLPYSGR